MGAQGARDAAWTPTRGPQLRLPVRQWLGSDAGIRLRLAGDGVLAKLLLSQARVEPHPADGRHGQRQYDDTCRDSGRRRVGRVQGRGIGADQSRSAEAGRGRHGDQDPTGASCARPAPGYGRAPALHRGRKLTCFHAANACVRRAAPSERPCASWSATRASMNQSKPAASLRRCRSRA